MKTKRCSKCGAFKPRSEFHWKNKAKNWLQSRCKPCHIEEVSDRRGIKKLWKYKLSLEEYDNLVLSQCGACAICGQTSSHYTNSGNVKELAVDHNHKTGTIRGLLCFDCNVGLGHFKDNPVFLKMAFSYLNE